MNENKSFTIEVVDGFYVGDLCYALDRETYDNDWGNKHKYKDGAYEVEEGEYAMVGTAYGDGYYDDQLHNSYPVDAGIIGICSLSLVKQDITNLGQIILFDGQVTIEYDEGIIYIYYGSDKLIINTTSMWQYEDEDE